MASAKEYEILFMLKAQVDSAFATGFNNARGYLLSMQEEINRYKGVLRDISAYQRTQQSINRLNDSIQQSGTTTAAQTQKLQDYQNRLKQIETELQNAGVDTSKLTDEQTRLQGEMEAVQQQMEEWKQFQNTINDLANAFSVMKMGADMVAGAVGKMNQAIGSAIDSAGELQFTMSAVRGISGATEEETAALTALAKETGATTIYTASEAAQALQTEALAGWSVNQMLAGMPAVVNLAAASGEDLSSMTSIVSDSLNAFGLSGEAAVTRFADVLTKAATSSNTTVSLMGESLSHVESTAANLGYSIEDVSLLLAVLANNALKGSVSGTALNTTLTRMSGANATASKEMERLGLSMYDDAKQAKPLIQFMNELRSAFRDGSMTAQEMQVSAYKLAGQRGMRGLLSIVNASEEEWSRLTEEINNCKGAAQSVSDIRLDNYRGQVYLLESAMDALKTSTGEAFLPMATYAAELGTQGVTWLNDFVNEHQNLVTTLAAGAEGAGAMATAIGGVSTALQAAKYYYNTWSEELQGILISGLKVAGIAAAVGAAIGAYINYCVQAEEETRSFRKEMEGLGEQVAGDISSYQKLVQGYEDARTKGNELVGALARISNWSEGAAGKNEQLAETVRELNELYPELRLRVDETTGALNMPLADISSAVNHRGQQEWNDRKSGLETLRSDEAAAKQAAEEAEREYQYWKNKGNEEMRTSWLGTTSISTGLNAENAAATRDSTQQNYERIRQEREAAEAALREYAAQTSGLPSLDLNEDQLTEITELATAYGDAWLTAYEKAGKALDGIYGLLKKPAELEQTSVSKLQENLDEQLKQAQDYQQNLQAIFDAANASGLDLSPIMDDLISGSADAQAAAQAIAQSVSDGSSDSLEMLLNTQTELQSTIDAIKNTYAENTSEVITARDALADGMNFSDLNLAEQAQAVAESVIQAIVAEMGSDEPANTTKATADAMTAAMRNNLQYSTFYGISYNALGGAVQAVKERRRQLAEEARKMASELKAAFSVSAPSGGSGYATGTVSAAQGFHVVGENGPEIVWFDGGEQVTNASETRELMRSYQELTRPSVELPSVSKTVSSQESRILQVSYSPVIQMSGGNEADIEDILRRNNEELKEQLNEWMDERETAQARRGW